MSEYARRLAELLRRHLGTHVLAALEEPGTEEIYVNPDMIVRTVSRDTGRNKTAARLRASDVEAFLRAVATYTGTEISDERPTLAAVLPREFGKCRLQGFLPPVVEGPSLIIRKPLGRGITRSWVI